MGFKSRAWYSFLFIQPKVSYFCAETELGGCDVFIQEHRPRSSLNVYIVISTRPHSRWSPTGQSFCSIFFSESEQFFSLLYL